MVEAVHAAGAHSGFNHITVPSLPDGGSSVVDRIEPAGVLALEEHLVGQVRQAVFGQCGHEDGGAEEAGLQTVAVVGKVLTEAGNHVFAGLSLYQAVLQGEERRGLHRVEHVNLELTVSRQEAVLEVLAGLAGNALIFGSVAAGGAGHVGHHLSIHQPVATAQIAPPFGGLGAHEVLALFVDVADGAGAGLQGFVAQPVGPLHVVVLRKKGLVVVLRLGQVVQIAFEGRPVLVDNLRIGKLLPDDPRHNDGSVRPAQATHVLGRGTVLGQGRNAGETAQSALRIAQVACPLMKE